MQQLIFLILFFQLIVFASEAQDLSKHQWENRILLICTGDQTPPFYQQQISTLKSHQSGLRERKLIIYQVSNDLYKLGLDEGSNWKKADDSFLERVNRKKKKGQNFNVVLIGLDGGVKLEKQEVLSMKELLSIIDAMPMLANELRNQNNSN